MDIVIILLNWNDEDQTLDCLQSIRAWVQLQPKIIIVDNYSDETAYQKLKDQLLTEICIRNNKNGGFAGGNNLGIKKALALKAPYILLLNTDASVEESTILKLIQRLEHFPSIQIIGPCIQEGSPTNWKYLMGGKDIARYAATRIEGSEKEVQAISTYPLHYVEYVSGTIFLARADLFKEIGLLDEDYFFSGEIADFCRRVKKNGHQIAVDLEVKAWHYTEKSTSYFRDVLYPYYSLRNRFLFVQKHYPTEKKSLYFFWIKSGLRVFIGALLRGNIKRARAIYLAIYHALITRFGNQNESFL